MCGFVSITIWSLIVSNLEETNLISRLRDQGASRGRNQVRDSSQDLIFFILVAGHVGYSTFFQCLDLWFFLY
jgi:hypothetical protein